MKLRSLIILTIMVNTLPSLSQIDTTSLNFYPLHTNNCWQYRNYTKDLFGPFSWISYYSVEVIGDTIFSNGKEYKVLEQISLDSLQTRYLYFERIDTPTCNVYFYYPWVSGDEVLMDSLKSQLGDTSTAYRGQLGYYGDGSYCDSVYVDSILSNQTISKRIRLLDPLNMQYHTLSQGFGITHQFAAYDFGITTIDLVYALIEGNEYGQPVFISDQSSSEVTQSISLYPNYPNPFNPITNIEFYLDKTKEVELTIYSIDGRLVERIVSSKLSSGFHRYKWDGKGLPSGVYIYQLSTGTHVYRNKCILLK